MNVLQISIEGIDSKMKEITNKHGMLSVFYLNNEQFASQVFNAQ